MVDDDKPESSDDPWAGLEAEGLPDLAGDFSFSFDGAPAADAEPTKDDELPGWPSDEPVAGDELVAGDEPLTSEELVAEDEPLTSEELVAEDEQPTAGLEAFGITDADDAAARVAEQDLVAGSATAADSDIDAWLGAPGSVDDFPSTPDGPELSVFHSDDSESDGIGSEDEAASLLAGHSSVEIGTGLSGFPSPSSLGAFTGDDSRADEGAMFDEGAVADEEPQEPAVDMFAFATSEEDAPAEGGDDDQAFAFSASKSESEEEADLATVGGLGLAAATVAHSGGAVTGRPTTLKSAKPPARRKKPSMVGQLVGVVLGGALSFPIVLAILWWAIGKDPLQIAPMMPDSLSFLVPAKFRPGAVGLAASGAGKAPSLDDILGNPEDTAGSPDTTELAETDPVMEPVPDSAPAEPDLTDLAVVDPPLAADAGTEDDDPLMALLNDSDPPAAPPEPVAPPPPPEPEPLDIAGLERTAAAAAVALEAVTAIDDPADPVFKSLSVKWYRALAAYAEELAMLERVAADSGRPLESLPDAVADVHRGLTAHPEMFEPLARLTSNWLAFSKRGSDGVVVAATFVTARRVGPYWRADVRLGDRPLSVLTRAEPEVSPGAMVIVTGLAIDGDTLWATAIESAEAASPFGL